MVKALGPIKTVGIDAITPYKNNPRNNEKAVGGVAKSLQAYGWQQPIVVDKDNVIVAGHTRYLAAQELGLEVVPVVMADFTDEEAKGYRLADNKTGEGATWDNKKLLEELAEINDDLFTGFDYSTIFDDVLDESDNSPLEENEAGVTYQLKLTTQNKQFFDSVKEKIDQEAMLNGENLSS